MRSGGRTFTRPLMTKRDIGILGFRLLAIWISFLALQTLVLIVPGWFVMADDWFGRIAGSLIAVGLPVGIAILLWVKAAWFSGRVFSNATTEDDGIAVVTPRDIQAVAFSIIGFYLICISLPEVVYWVYVHFSSRFHGSVRVSLTGSTYDTREGPFDSVHAMAQMLALATRIVIGIVLLAGPRTIVGVTKRAVSVLSFPTPEQVEMEEARSEQNPERVGDDQGDKRGR